LLNPDGQANDPSDDEVQAEVDHQVERYTTEGKPARPFLVTEKESTE
jgi:hypothetical protein